MLRSLMKMKTITLQKGVKDTPKMKVEKMMQQVARPGMSLIHFVMIVIHCISSGLGIVRAFSVSYILSYSSKDFFVMQPASAAVPLTSLSMFPFQFPSFLGNFSNNLIQWFFFRHRPPLTHHIGHCHSLGFFHLFCFLFFIQHFIPSYT